MNKLILLLLVAGGMAYAGTKYYLHSEVSDAMDLAVLMASPYAKLEYEGVESTVTGELTVVGVKVQVNGFEDPLLIDRIGIDTPSFLSLLTLTDFNDLMREGMPSSIGFLVEGLHMPADADYYRALYDFSMQARGISDDSGAAAECTGKYGLSPATLEGLGYDEQVFSMSMAAHSGRTSYTIEMSTRSEAMWDFEAVFTMDGDMTSELSRGAAFRPRLSDMQIEYTDRSLNERIRAYCGRRGLSDAETRQAQLDAFNYFGESNGVVFDDFILGPYQEFLDGKSTLVVTAKPNEPIALSQIDLYKPEDVPALLNLEASAR